MTMYRVSWVNAPDGRVLDSTTETDMGVIRCIAARLSLVGEDELLVIEPVSVDEAISDNNRNREKTMPNDTSAARLEYLRKELRAERMSYGDLAELQSLAAHIDPGDVELLEAAGVPEFRREDSNG